MVLMTYNIRIINYFKALIYSLHLEAYVVLFFRGVYEAEENIC